MCNSNIKIEGHIREAADGLRSRISSDQAERLMKEATAKSKQSQDKTKEPEGESKSGSSD